jgi:hypothetical protein
MRRVALAVAGLVVAAVPALALAQEASSAAGVTLDVTTMGALLAAVVAAVGGGGAAGWRASRTAAPDPIAAGATTEALAELKRDLRALTKVVDENRAAAIRATERLAALSDRLAAISAAVDRTADRVEEAIRAHR